MRQASTRGGLLAALLTTTAGVAAAQPAADFSWDLSASLLHRRLQERSDTGARLLEETGPLLRLGLEGRWALRGGGALAAGASIAAGDLDYEGRTQAGVPLTTDSAHRDLALSAAWRPLPPASWGEGWLVLRALQQRREIASTATAGGLTETSILWLPGVRWSGGFDAAGWRLRPSVELRASVHHRLAVDYGGVFDSSRLRGGRRWEATLGIEAVSAGSPWSWGVEWTHAHQAASDRQALYRNGAAVGTVRQPRLRIDDVGVRVRRSF